MKLFFEGFEKKAGGPRGRMIFSLKTPAAKDEYIREKKNSGTRGGAISGGVAGGAAGGFSGGTLKQKLVRGALGAIGGAAAGGGVGRVAAGSKAKRYADIGVGYTKGDLASVLGKRKKYMELNKAAFSLFGKGTGPSTPPPTPPSPPTSTGPRMNPAGVKSLKNAFGG